MVMKLITRPESAPQWKRGPRQPETALIVVRRMKRLAVVRDEVAAELGLEPGLVCPKSCALAVASREPRCADTADLREAGLTGWRLELLGPRLIAALADE